MRICSHNYLLLSPEQTIVFRTWTSFCIFKKALIESKNTKTNLFTFKLREYLLNIYTEKMLLSSTLQYVDVILTRNSN